MRFSDIILPVPFEAFTYSLPPELAEGIDKGSRVLVEFGKSKQYAGIVTRLHDEAPQGVNVKPVLAVLDAAPIVTPLQFSFWRWVADYYMCPLGDVYKAAFPGRLKKDDTPKTTRRRTTLIDRLSTLAPGGITHALNAAQQRAYDAILATWTEGKETTLLHGVTSSGKTEIYIHLIQRALDAGQQVLYLLPEIALTTQITERLRRVFGGRLGVFHSKFTERERVDVYRHQLSDHPFDVILGVRSSVFLPFRRLGLVIVDEEHETSYKQQEPAPRYHARNAALMLARLSGAKTVLGTATPSIESYHLAREGRFGYVPLTQRYSDMQLPEIEVVDIKRLRFQKRMRGAFSQRLIEEIQGALERHEQVILFQNRRGFSHFVECAKCGWVPRCRHCDVSLTYHKRSGSLVCHYCGAVYPMPTQCPSCHSCDSAEDATVPTAPDRFVTVGAGTERIEEQISKLFPQARVSRMDLDTAKTRAAYERMIEDFAEGASDILIGTQMVSKGLDFDRVSVVGILDADTMLNLPDFRSYERTFHILSQVAGRAGRKGHKGKVILQTRSADSPLIRQVVENDFAGMFDAQMEERQLFHYPPFCRLIYVYLRHRDNDTLEHLAEDMAAELRRRFGTDVLGPDRPPVSRVQSMHIRKIVVKASRTLPGSTIRQGLYAARQHLLSLSYAANVNIYFDVDPM